MAIALFEKHFQQSIFEPTQDMIEAAIQLLMGNTIHVPQVYIDNLGDLFDLVSTVPASTTKCLYERIGDDEWYTEFKPIGIVVAHIDDALLEKYITARTE